jgi:predicted TPR repeat methyltransferase
MPEPSGAVEERVSELTVDEAVSIGIQLHQRGFLEEARTVYERILEIQPDQPDALHFLGVVKHQSGGGDDAVELIRRSIALAPGMADRHNNLGNALVERERLEEAVEAYRRAIELDPRHANAHSNLGAALRVLRRFDEAAEAYRTAIEINPDHADAHNNMGNLLSHQGRVKEALAYYCKAVTLSPRHPESNKMLGIAYYTLGQIDKAAEVFREWLDKEPGNPVARHMYAACSGQDTPPRASDAFVESTFDTFASSFDAKLGRLAYRAPQLVADAVARCLGTPAGTGEGLDAGCGTGLCGPLIAPFVERLVGVDLSAGMLVKARARNVYDELTKAELTAYLEAHPGHFDLVVSADTLCYFGPLETLLRMAWCALRPGGLLVFTVEEAADAPESFRLNPHGRYSHGSRYVTTALAAAGFSAIDSTPGVLRNEGGSPVAGLVMSARRAGLAVPGASSSRD